MHDDDEKLGKNHPSSTIDQIYNTQMMTVFYTSTIKYTILPLCILLIAFIRLNQNCYENVIRVEDRNIDETIGNNKIEHFYQCTWEEKTKYPKFCGLLYFINNIPVELASQELFKFSESLGTTINFSSLLGTSSDSSSSKVRTLRNIEARHEKVYDLPVVVAHGMGDSCFNDGIQSISQHISGLTNQYTTCIPTADNVHDDTFNGFFLNMDASVDIFASKIQADANLRNGFHAIGFSQGNNIIRGYIARYNDPPVNTFISVNGVNAGIGAVPACIPSTIDDNYHESIETTPSLSNRICDVLMEVASHQAYTEFSQKHSFQANYWRDPRPEQYSNYVQYSQLAQWNNEDPHHKNTTYNVNYSKTTKFVWIKANQDKIVWPAEGEWWGAPDPNDPFHHILEREETDWFREDFFGLKSAELEGKNFYESFDGDHLRFDLKSLDRWIETYLVAHEKS